MIPDGLRQRILAWRAEDPDPVTRARTDDLLREADSGSSLAEAELTDAFGGRLSFGTAGLRGALGPGPNRMNRVVVGQAAAGLAWYLRDQGLSGGRVIIGYDARHNSDVFARDTAAILAGAGFEPLLSDRFLPTPVIAYGIRALDCVAGVVVTASHNPPQDNGYKVYLGDGSQIVPPADAEIAEQIEAAARTPLSTLSRSDAITSIGLELINAYVERAASLVGPEAPRQLHWVYTPLHGVGGGIVDQVVARAGFPLPEVVEAQREPDPDFPTVDFPNPEEPGAIDLALARAAEVGPDLVVANDPDADRCAVAVAIEGAWRMLSGDELGALLADDRLRRGAAGTYACSIVSSTLLAAMARHHDQPFVWTLTGFKWIGRVPGLVFGYEEAIGYCCDPDSVADKDGISALVRILALAAQLKVHGQTLADRLDEIAVRHGLFASDQLSVRVEDLALITGAMTRLRDRPPRHLLGEPVEVTDLAYGSPDLPPTDGILLEGAAVRAVVRPSGTEPKLKCYLEVRLPVHDDLPEVRLEARRRLDLLRDELSADLGLRHPSSASASPAHPREP